MEQNVERSTLKTPLCFLLPPIMGIRRDRGALMKFEVKADGLQSQYEAGKCKNPGAQSNKIL